MIRRIASRWMLMAVAVLTIVPLAGAQAQIAGDWQGIANVEGTDYHIIVHITAAKDGALAATLDSPELGVTGVATSGVNYKDSKFSMNVDAYHGVYTGTLSGDGTKITGVFAGDHDTPIEFTRVTATAAAPSSSGSGSCGGCGGVDRRRLAWLPQQLQHDGQDIRVRFCTFWQRQRRFSRRQEPSTASDQYRLGFRGPPRS